ncbi:MAG: hypothetical protein Q4G03_07065 [Planctomycetia bacterium]|nr:hypothetical protein [Planctomycetia bacterium]
MSSRAILVLSGKLLEKEFALEALATVHMAIERELMQRDTILTRCVVTLSNEHFAAAPYFLQAGFEVLPADEEDLQAAVFLTSCTEVRQDVDQVVFALGRSLPLNFLRTLNGRANRTLLSFESTSETNAWGVESLISVPELLARYGVDYNAFPRVPWSSSGTATPLPQFSPDARSVSAPIVAPNATVATVASASAYSTDSDASLTSTVAPRQEDPAGDVEELCQIDPFADFEENASIWNAELEELVVASGGKCSAYKAVEQLDVTFAGLVDFYLHERDRFERLLSPSLKLIRAENGVDAATYLYHTSHEELQPIASDDAVELLTLGSSLPTEDSGDSENGSIGEFGADRYAFNSLEEYIPALEDVARLSDLSCEQCKWQIDRKKLMEQNVNFDQSIKPTDNEMTERAMAMGVYLWVRKFNNLTDQQLLDLAECYKLVSESIRFFEEVIQANAEINDRVHEQYLQFVVNVQCLLKTLVAQTSGDYNRDLVQKNLFLCLIEYRKLRFPRTILHNLKRESILDFDQLLCLQQELYEKKSEFEELCEYVKKRRACESRLKYHVEQLRKAVKIEKAVEDWNKVVAAVTTLCKEFRERPSSLLFRELLGDIIGSCPETVEITEEYARVVQTIEIEDAEEEAAFIEAAPREESKAVARVKEIYEGTKFVFVGGSPQDHMRERIEKAFNVELIWTESSHGDSLDRFGSSLRAREVTVFLVYIPWCSHKHSEELAQMVRQAGKEIVRLRKGTNPVSIAEAMCEQLDLFA